MNHYYRICYRKLNINYKSSLFKLQFKKKFSSGLINDVDNSSENNHEQIFVDTREIILKSGSGGNGAIKFRADKGRAKGPAYGGDGGRGGSIYVVGSPNEYSLHKLKGRYIASDGSCGGIEGLDGKPGTDIIIKVPLGTCIKLNQPRETFFRETFTPLDSWIHLKNFEQNNLDSSFFKKLHKNFYKKIRGMQRHDRENDYLPDKIEIFSPGVPICILRGGRGGLGNRNFIMPNIRNPRFAIRGALPIGGSFTFELKMIADLGLVGMPNAGKSTLLRAISSARPKIGDWEFTTLTPSLGVVSMGLGKGSFTVVDVPGLIEGANENKGMGIGFLKHLERCAGFLFVVGLDKPDPISDINLLIKEMGGRTRGKKVLVIANKADLQDTEGKYNLVKNYCIELGWDSIPICAKDSKGIDNAIRKMSSIVQLRL